MPKMKSPKDGAAAAPRVKTGVFDMDGVLR